MANRGGPYTLYQSTTDGVNYVDLGWTSGATGAVPASYPGGTGWNRTSDEIKSVTRTGTGAYTIALSGPWYAAMARFQAWTLQATYANTGACSVYIVEDHSTNTTTPELKILTTNAAGTAVDMATTDQINLTFGLVIKPSY